MARASTAGKPRVTSATERPRRGRTPSAEIVALRPPAWDWAFFEDGALALDRHELWEEPPEPSDQEVSQTPPAPSRLKRWTHSATVARMPSARAPRAARRARRRANRRVQRIAILVIVASIVLVTASLTAFGSSQAASTPAAAPAPSARLVPDTPPRAQIVAMVGSVRVQLPVNQGRLTATRLPRHAERRALARAARATRGTAARSARGLRLGVRHAERRPASSTGWTAAAARTPASSTWEPPPGRTSSRPSTAPSSASPTSCSTARRYGVRIDIQPSSAPSLVVSLTRLARRPGADRRHDRRGGPVEARHRARPLAASSGRRSRATRRTRGTTSRSRCIRPPRWRSP